MYFSPHVISRKSMISEKLDKALFVQIIFKDQRAFSFVS